MEGLSAGADKDKFLGKSTDDVTGKRDSAKIDLSAANEDCITVELYDLQIEVTSRNSETADTVEGHDAYDKLLDDRKCTCNDDTAFLTRPAASDLKKAGCVSIGEEECRICQSSGEEVLISPCKCAGSAKWVHESCLVKWFQVSQTSSCELCSLYVAIKERTKPLQQWRLPSGNLGPCSRVDLWYLFVTVFSICTIFAFCIFQLLVKSKEPETTAVFAAIYSLCGVMILLRMHYFYVWFTRRSAFWKKWKILNRVWTVASPGAVLKVDKVATIV